jgi:hypothetical protein
VVAGGDIHAGGVCVLCLLALKEKYIIGGIRAEGRRFSAALLMGRAEACRILE